MIVTLTDLYVPGRSVTPRLRVLFREVNNAGVAVAATQAIDFTLDIKDGYAAIIRALHATAQATGGENITKQSIGYRSPAGDTTSITGYLRWNVVAAAANAQHVLDWQGEVVLLPGYVIRSSVTKNAGVQVIAAHQLHVYGFLIPLGNLQP